MPDFCSMCADVVDVGGGRWAVAVVAHVGHAPVRVAGQYARAACGGPVGGQFGAAPTAGPPHQ